MRKLLFIIGLLIGLSASGQIISYQMYPKVATGASVINTGFKIATGAGTTTTGNISTIGASEIIVAMADRSGATTTPNLTDNQGNTWTVIRNDKEGSSPNIIGTVIARCFSCTTSATHTFTTTDAYSSIYVIVVSGTSADDQNNGSISNGVNCQPGSITPTVTNTIAVNMVMGWLSTSTPTTPTGYTAVGGTPFVSAQAYASGCFYKILTTVASENPTSTLSIAQPFAESSIMNSK